MTIFIFGIPQNHNTLVADIFYDYASMTTSKSSTDRIHYKFWEQL